ncbi:MAG: hypothetical protein HC765_01650 [Brachymonas sp.]|nr:hypothetical protein [Brachymonas sp.]
MSLSLLIISGFIEGDIMKVLKIAKWLTMGAIATIVAACGGGSGSSDTLPPRSQLNIAGIDVSSYSYSQGVGTTTVKISVANGLEILESIIPAFSAGPNTNTFAGFGAILELPSDLISGFPTAQAIEINLAAEATPSAGATRTIKIQLKGAASTQNNGCLPTAEVQVPTNLTQFVLPLTVTQFPLPSFCATANPANTNPPLAGVVVDIVAIQVEDGNIAATAVASKISIGKLAFAAAPVVVVPPPVDTTPGVLVASFSTAAGTAATVQGGAILGGYRYAGNEANLSVPTKTIEGGNLLQWSSFLSGDEGGFSGSASQFVPSVTNWSTVSQVSLQVSTDRPSYQFRVVLKGGVATGGCEYQQDMPAGSVSTTLQTVSLAISAFQRNQFGCAPVSPATTPPTLEQVLAEVAEITVLDTSWQFGGIGGTGARTSQNRVGDVRISE